MSRVPLRVLCEGWAKCPHAEPGFDSAEVSRYPQHPTRPCQERKDGVPNLTENSGTGNLEVCPEALPTDPPSPTQRAARVPRKSLFGNSLTLSPFDPRFCPYPVIFRPGQAIESNDSSEKEARIHGYTTGPTGAVEGARSKARPEVAKERDFGMGTLFVMMRVYFFGVATKP